MEPIKILKSDKIDGCKKRRGYIIRASESMKYDIYIMHTLTYKNIENIKLAESIIDEPSKVSRSKLLPNYQDKKKKGKLTNLIDLKN